MNRANIKAPNKIYGAAPELHGEYEASSGGASRFFYCAKASKSERNLGLDGYEIINISCSEWENADLKVQLRVDMEASPPRVIDVSGVPSKSVCEWNTFLFGNVTADEFQKECKSIIETEINSTIKSKTLNWLLRYNTSASILDANCEEIDGGSLAVAVESLNPSMNITNDAMAIAMNATHVQSSVRLRIKSEGVNRSTHPTVKPLKLMRYPAV